MLEALLEKYSQMLGMRERDGSDDVGDPRAEMAALARRFPGSLREIDERQLEDIRARVEQLQLAVSGQVDAPEWAPLQAGYHGAMRAFLRMRPLLRGASQSEGLAVVEQHYRPLSSDEPPRDAMVEPLLSRVRAPPGGRLNGVVFEYVAGLHGVSPDEVSAALFRRLPPNRGIAAD